ncbi:MAG: hypothetical protein WBZ33_03125 [Thermoactinomyces sp.]|jgi:hypothetical protein
MQKQESLARRKLDERVADEVMGLIVVKEGCPEVVVPGMVMTMGVWKRYYIANHDKEKPSKLEALRLRDYSLIPYYAWEVVERMQSLGFDYSIQSQGKQVTVQFTKGEKIGTGVSESMPKSVCLAALEAIQGYWDEK